MSNSFKATDEQVIQIKEHYKDYQIENNNDLVLYQFKYNNCNIMVYKSLSVVINGKDTLEEVKNIYFRLSISNYFYKIVIKLLNISVQMKLAVATFSDQL